jgi:ammonia channel protein AmtB
VVACWAGGGWAWSQGMGDFGSVEVCRSAASASMVGLSTTGFRRRVRGVETGVRLARFALRNFSKAETRAVPVSGVCVSCVFTAD